MKKIRLDPESLEVVSFATAKAPEARGTVKGANTGYTCYATVAYQDTMCLYYAPSYWEEDTCRCEPVRYTEQAGCDTAFDQLTC
jgi:hypothetical protein